MALRRLVSAADENGEPHAPDWEDDGMEEGAAESGSDHHVEPIREAKNFEEVVQRTEEGTDDADDPPRDGEAAVAAAALTLGRGAA